MILITGATGFLGTHLLLYLLEKKELVKAIYRTEEKLEATKKWFLAKDALALFEKVIWVKADVTDIPSLLVALENCDSVIHTAALISFNREDETLLRKINIEGTANVVNCCLSKNIKKLIYISSIASLGESLVENELINEETPWNPSNVNTDYAISKYGAEMEVWRGKEEGLAVIILNPGVILGTGYWQTGSSQIIEKISKGLPFYTSGVTGFVSVDDVVKCIYKFLGTEINGERYILVSKNYGFFELSTKVASLCNVASPKYYFPKWLFTIVCFFDFVLNKLKIKKRTFTTLLIKALYSKSYYDASKVKRELQFEFEDFEETLKKITSNLKKTN